MRILYLHDYADLSGGAEHQLDKLRARTEAAGHQTRLVASDTPLADPPRYAEARMVPGRTGRRQVATQAANRAAQRAVRDEVRAFAPDLVHVRMFLWQLSPLALAPLGDVPVVYQACVYKAVCPNGRRLLPGGEACSFPPGGACLREGCFSPQAWAAMMGQRALLRRYRSRIDATVTLSTRMRDEMEGLGWPVRTVIPNGVEARPPPPPRIGPPEVGYAGRLDREKGVDTLLDAAARCANAVPDLKLTIVGDGPWRERLEAQARTLGLDARFTGRLPREAMERTLEAAWVQAVPSLWEEPFGNVTTEAMMRGTAVLASAVGGQVDIVADGEVGALVPPGDAGAWADGLTTYLTDRGRAERDGASGRERALARFTDEAVADAYAGLYAELLAEARA